MTWPEMPAVATVAVSATVIPVSSSKAASKGLAGPVTPSDRAVPQPAPRGDGPSCSQVARLAGDVVEHKDVRLTAGRHERQDRLVGQLHLAG